VTEQVAAHTNGTIGALLNATFGNAPELLISTAALRSGFYRVLQLAMLGSMLTNLLFVFGVACLVGGFRWQVQELRITSGNVSVLLLLVATAGSMLPAVLNESGQMQHKDSPTGTPSIDELHFSRVNAFVLMGMYVCYLIFQLGTHKEEFDEEENIVETPDNLLLMSPHFTSRHGRQKRAERNHFCLKCFSREPQAQRRHGYTHVDSTLEAVFDKSKTSDSGVEMGLVETSDLSDSSDDTCQDNVNPGSNREPLDCSLSSRSLPSGTGSRRRHRRGNLNRSFELNSSGTAVSSSQRMDLSKKPLNENAENNQEASKATTQNDENERRKCQNVSLLLSCSH
jgi:Ca2+/Na+ antiporter